VSVLTRVDKQIDFDWDAASPSLGVPATNFSVRWTGTFTPPAPGKYRLSIRQLGCWRCGDAITYELWFDGRKLYDSHAESAPVTRSNPGAAPEVNLTDTAPHALRIDYVYKAQRFGAGLTFDWQPPAGALQAEAVEAAKNADVVLAFVGISPNLEGEEMPVHVDGFAGGDRTSIDLPKTQRELLEALGATGKPVVVVLMSGSAVATPWAKEHAAALLEAWYPGEAGGEAIANVLTGRVNPSGRLPVTFYASNDQLPPFSDYSMQARTYRYFPGQPEYPFGFGLSYSTFSYSGLRLASPSITAGDPLQATVTVTNTGDRPGDTVAELYLDPPQGQGYPLRSLESFQRVHLAAHASTTVHFTLDARELSEVDAQGHRAVRAGAYRLMAGGSSPASNAGSGFATAQFTIRGSKNLPE
jgi:beta-glucosidase